MCLPYIIIAMTNTISKVIFEINEITSQEYGAPQLDVD